MWTEVNSAKNIQTWRIGACEYKVMKDFQVSQMETVSNCGFVLPRSGSKCPNEPTGDKSNDPKWQPRGAKATSDEA